MEMAKQTPKNGPARCLAGDRFLMGGLDTRASVANCVY